MNKALLFVGCLFVFIGFFNPILPPVYISRLSIISSHHNLPPVPDSVSPLPVPFYTHDAEYLYLNPAGLCRFASRQMILSYWGFEVSQYTLFVEEKHAAYNETRFSESFTNRGFIVVEHFALEIPLHFYANGQVFRVDGDAEDNVYFARFYLSVGIPLFAGVAVNSEGWVDEDGWPLPNHAIVLTGYNETGFFYHNPISLNLSKPSCGPNKFVDFETFKKGLTEHFWFFEAVFPKDYTPILTSIRVKVSGSRVYSIFGSSPVINGYATVKIMKTGSMVTVDFPFPTPNVQTFGMDGYEIAICYPDTTNIPKLILKPSEAPLTPHPPEPIPERPAEPPSEPEYPYEPIPHPAVELVEKGVRTTPYIIPTELLIGPTLIAIALIWKEKEG